MKKILSIILVCVVAIDLFGCDGKQQGLSDKQADSSNNQQTNSIVEEKKISYKHDDCIKILNVIDVDDEIMFINPTSDDGFFKVRLKNNGVCCDTRGNIITNWSYDNFESNSVINGFTLFKDKNSKKYGLIDINGRIVLNPEYDSIKTTIGSCFCVEKNKKFYILNKDLNEIFKYNAWEDNGVTIGKTHYTTSPAISDGLVNVSNEKGMWGYVDLKGKKVIDFKYYLAGVFRNNYAAVVGKNNHNEHKWGLIDRKGNLIIDYQYDSGLDFKNGISNANKDGIGYYININNEKVLNGLLFEETDSFNEGLAGVKKNEKWGFIDTNGREVYPCIFDEVNPFNNGIATAVYKNKVVILTYLDSLPFGFTNVDVDNAYAKLNQIDGSSYWTDLRRKQANNISKENWSNKDYEDDFNYTLTYKEVQPNTWYVTGAGVWYYFENDRTTRKTGWYNEPKDGQTYYLNPTNGVMATGWTEIDGDMYYFNEEHSSTPNWYYIPESDSWESHGKNIKAYGSMFRDETTPDGKKVDKDGKLIK